MVELFLLSPYNATLRAQALPGEAASIKDILLIFIRFSSHNAFCTVLAAQAAYQSTAK
jgi:hypothetical protein